MFIIEVYVQLQLEVSENNVVTLFIFKFIDSLNSIQELLGVCEHQFKELFLDCLLIFFCQAFPMLAKYFMGKKKVSDTWYYFILFNKASSTGHTLFHFFPNTVFQLAKV